MTTSNSACMSCVVVLNQQQQAAIQHQQSCESSTLQPPKRLHKLCTVVENGKVVVRPIECEPPQD